MSSIDKSKILPYGDTLNDGKVQLGFTLPVPNDELGIACAKEIAKSMGLIHPEVVHAHGIHPDFTYYIVYGELIHPVDYTTLKVNQIETSTLSMHDIEAYIEEYIKRPIVVVGASTGSDAHTVGIDAIMNMKGLAGHYGLERYKGIIAYNLGSQVENEIFIKKAKDVQADVLLVSQTVTQKEVHIKNLTHLVELLEAEGMRDDVLLIVGGARITNELAKELGYDAGFGVGKFAEDVASFFVKELAKKIQKNQTKANEGKNI